MSFTYSYIYSIWAISFVHNAQLLSHYTQLPSEFIAYPSPQAESKNLPSRNDKAKLKKIAKKAVIRVSFILALEITTSKNKLLVMLSNY